MNKRLGILTTKQILRIGYLLPILFLIWHVSRFYLERPWFDHWLMISFFDKVASGNVRLADLFAIHAGDHRPVFPKIIFTILAFATGWQLKYEVYGSILLTVITFWAMCKINSSRAGRAGGGIVYVTNLFTCMLLFSLVQETSWKWGWAQLLFLVNTCVALAVLSLMPTDPRHVYRKFSAAAACCFVASFSVVHGLLSWIALLPSVIQLALSDARRARLLAIWISLAAATWALYFVGFDPGKETGPFFLLLRTDPLRIGRYFFSLLGCPLGGFTLWTLGSVGGNPVLTALGVAVVAGFSFFSVVIFKNLRSRFGRYGIPWVSVGLFALLYAAANTAGRVSGLSGGPKNPIYATPATLLSVSVIQLGGLFLGYDSIERRRFHKLAYQVLAGVSVGVITCLISLNYAYFIAGDVPREEDAIRDKACLELAYYLEPWNTCDIAVGSFSEEVRILDRLGFRNFRKDLKLVTDPPEDYGRVESVEKRVARNEAVIKGWARFPDREQQPSIVMLSRNRESPPAFFAYAVVNLESPDVAQGFGSRKYSRARWEGRISIRPTSIFEVALPAGQTTIRAWVYDPDRDELVLLKGEVSVER